MVVKKKLSMNKNSLDIMNNIKSLTIKIIFLTFPKYLIRNL